jgi:hypothetical protein
MEGSVGIENNLWHGRIGVRVSAEKLTYLEDMHTEFEAKPASCSTDTWKGGRGSG